MFQKTIADVVLSTEWMLGILAGSGAVIGLLFRLLITAKDQEIERLKRDFELFVEQAEKDDLRHEKENAQVELLIETIRKQHDPGTDSRR